MMIRRQNVFRMAILAIAGLGTAVLVSPGLAQTDPLVGRFPVVTKAPEMPLGLLTMTPQSFDDPAAASMVKLTHAKAELAAAKTDEEQFKAKTALQGVLTEIFDLDLKQRKQRIDDLNKRLSGIQEKFEKRSAAKNNIIELQLKLFAQEGVDGVENDQLAVLIPPGHDDLAAKIRDMQRARSLGRMDEYKTKLDEVSKAMEQYFDADMESRKKEMDAIKTQIAGMDKMVQTRLAKRDEIIGLRVQLAVNEAQGLGLFGETSTVEFVMMNGVKLPVYTPTVFHNLPVSMPPMVHTTFQPNVVTGLSGPGQLTEFSVTTKSPQSLTPRTNDANHAIRSGDLIVTIEPSEPAVLAINAGSGKIFWKHSLKDAGLSVTGPGQLDLDEGTVVVHKRDGGALKINAETGQVVLEMTADQVEKRYPVRLRHTWQLPATVPTEQAK